MVRRGALLLVIESASGVAGVLYADQARRYFVLRVVYQICGGLYAFFHVV